MMSEDQIAELLEIVRADPAIWEALKARELKTEKALADAARQGRQLDDRDVVLDPWLPPSRAEIISQVVERRYGKAHNLEHMRFTMAARRAVREGLACQSKRVEAQDAVSTECQRVTDTTHPS
jgi:hypothetical protein